MEIVTSSKKIQRLRLEHIIYTTPLAMFNSLKKINWKRFIIGTFEKRNVLPGILNLFTLCILIEVFTAVTTIFTSAETQYRIPIWFLVFYGVSFICGQYALLSHSLATLLIFVLLNAGGLGFLAYQLYLSSSNTLGILFSFALVIQIKAIEVWGLFWIEMKMEQQESDPSSGADDIQGSAEDHQRLEDEEEEEKV